MNLKEIGINTLTQIGAIDPMFKATNVYGESHFYIRDRSGKFIDERTYPSKPEALKSAGRERVFAKLEWAVGTISSVLGAIMFSSALTDPSLESYMRGERFLLATALLVVGGGYIRNMGLERRGIAGAIIKKLNHDQSPPTP